MGAVYLFSEALSPAQILAIYQLGPGYKVEQITAVYNNTSPRDSAGEGNGKSRGTFQYAGFVLGLLLWPTLWFYSLSNTCDIYKCFIRVCICSHLRVKQAALNLLIMTKDPLVGKQIRLVF